MLEDEGADALMTYGDASGYTRPARPGLPQVRAVRGAQGRPRQHPHRERLGRTRSSLAFSAFVDVGDAIITEAPTFSGTLNTIRRHGAELLGVPVDDEGIVTSDGARSAWRSCAARAGRAS